MNLEEDGRPCSMDIFASHLLDECYDCFDFQEAIKAWVEGAWDEALSFLCDSTQQKLKGK